MSCEESRGQSQQPAADDVDQIRDRDDDEDAAQAEEIEPPHPVAVQKEAEHGVIALVRKAFPAQNVQCAQNQNDQAGMEDNGHLLAGELLRPVDAVPQYLWEASFFFFCAVGLGLLFRLLRPLLFSSGADGRPLFKRLFAIAAEKERQKYCQHKGKQQRHDQAVQNNTLKHGAGFNRVVIDVVSVAVRNHQIVAARDGREIHIAVPQAPFRQAALGNRPADHRGVAGFDNFSGGGVRSEANCPARGGACLRPGTDKGRRQ